jgi:C4-type Zn-finger protein
MPHSGEAAHEWECRNCGRRTTGVFDENARETIRKNVIEIDRREAD